MRTPQLFVIRTQNLAGLWVHQMRLSARKARHLDVSEVIVFRIIRSPSLDVVARGAAVEEGGMILRFSFSWLC